MLLIIACYLTCACRVAVKYFSVDLITMGRIIGEGKQIDLRIILNLHMKVAKVLTIFAASKSAFYFICL